MSQPLLFLTHPVALSHLAPVPRRAASISRFSAGIHPAMQEDSVSGDFSPHTERDLSVTARHSGLSVSWQGTGRALGETSSTFDWFSRYAGSLFLTIVGSIMSAQLDMPSRKCPRASASHPIPTRGGTRSSIVLAQLFAKQFFCSLENGKKIIQTRNDSRLPCIDCRANHSRAIANFPNLTRRRFP
jgi:hypothetical protein